MTPVFTDVGRKTRTEVPLKGPVTGSFGGNATSWVRPKTPLNIKQEIQVFVILISSLPSPADNNRNADRDRRAYPDGERRWQEQAPNEVHQTRPYKDKFGEWPVVGLQ